MRIVVHVRLSALCEVIHPGAFSCLIREMTISLRLGIFRSACSFNEFTAISLTKAKTYFVSRERYFAPILITRYKSKVIFFSVGAFLP